MRARNGGAAKGCAGHDGSRWEVGWRPFAEDDGHGERLDGRALLTVVVVGGVLHGDQHAGVERVHDRRRERR